MYRLNKFKSIHYFCFLLFYNFMYKIFMDFILNVYTYSEDVKKLKID